ncbi:MAG: UDP-N-acetylmuramate--L-alanine ligase [Clostridia bacterium]
MKNPFIGKNIHLIGIGGISMSGLAKWCNANDMTVSGSDVHHSETLIELQELGINAYAGSNVSIAGLADIVVYSSAISEGDAELCFCRAKKIVCFERHRFLGIVASLYNEVIAVSGTHGKTTVTGLLSTIFKRAEKSFTAHIGGDVKDLNGNFYMSGEEYFITEACEYKHSFLSLQPNTIIILNVESDHPDCYNALSDLEDTFTKFVSNMQNDGLIVINRDVDYRNLHICTNTHMLTYGFDAEADCYATNILEYLGKCEYDVILNKEHFCHIKSNMFGRHNILNALAAILTANYYGVSKQNIIETIETFKGIKRRFEFVGEVNGARIVIDYAHHPSEIVATLDAAKKMQYRNLRVYFQPHTYSRTKKYFDEFANAFENVDELSIVSTYPARETPDMGATAFELFYYINTCVQDAKYFDTLMAVATNILKTAMPDDLILILGAGDIAEVAKLVLQ